MPTIINTPHERLKHALTWAQQTGYRQVSIDVADLQWAMEQVEKWNLVCESGELPNDPQVVEATDELT